MSSPNQGPNGNDSKHRADGTESRPIALRFRLRLQAGNVLSMSSDRVLDYLTEELVVEKNIVRVLCPNFVPTFHATGVFFQVTYRSLSIALGIHVNEAKKCVFYTSTTLGSR